MEIINIPMNASRVCAAISRIGYEPHSALMDIIDNSVAAEALNVRVDIDLVEDKTINQRNNVARYRIIDNGSGMGETGIQNAFKLGSDAEYKANSLSKYGMGLKSAGFSLGTRITLVSKKDGKLIPNKYFLDRKVIEDHHGEYVVCREGLKEEELVEYEALLAENKSGTIVEITGCGEIYHTSANTTIKKLKHRLGVTYYPFLAAPEGKRLNITLNYPGSEPYLVEPVDILYTEDADVSFDPTTYTCNKPCYAFNGEWHIQSIAGTETPPVKLEVISFPLDKMGRSGSPLPDDEKKRVQSYGVSRENKGFFIYRNGRLIRWGDDLDDIAPRDLINLRARIELTSEHDDLLHVDVSKQRLEMDDETKNALEMIMRLPRRQTKSINELCNDLVKKGNGEGAGFEETSAAVPEEDPVEELSPPDPKVRKERSKQRAEESRKTLEEIEAQEGEPEAEAEIEAEAEEAIEEFRRVRYADNLSGMSLWSAQKDTIQGSYVLINRRHAFYQSIISNLDESSPERLALEAIIYCSAVGENKTYENLTTVNDDEIRKVFERYFTVLSYNLGEWTNGNQHLFNK